MRLALSVPVAAFAAFGVLALAPAAHAAHAGAPYTNVDKRNDAGNPTGDDQVEKLNEQQLNANYKGPYTPAPAATPGAAPVAPSPAR